MKNIPFYSFCECCVDDLPKYIKRGLKEPKPRKRARHIGDAILNGTLGQSNSKLLLHGVFDENDVDDFGHEPKREDNTKKTE